MNAKREAEIELEAARDDLAAAEGRLGPFVASVAAARGRVAMHPLIPAHRASLIRAKRTLESEQEAREIAAARVAVCERRLALEAAAEREAYEAARTRDWLLAKEEIRAAYAEACDAMTTFMESSSAANERLERLRARTTTGARTDSLGQFRAYSCARQDLAALLARFDPKRWD